VPTNYEPYLGKFLSLGKQLVDLLGEVLLRLESSFGHGDGGWG
jgi:hypothetical protein